jgi:hypothetical protein
LAIIQISRIQVRRGLRENLPQLASAEFGWALDTRQLYIGNGLTEEGAPLLGNTEILTEYSNIFELSGTYTFKGLAAGYQVQTGVDFNGTIARSMQAKFDDIVNLRDFGGIGDGVTNEVVTINRAITQLYKESILASEARVRRTLEIPAGVYLLSGDFIRILPYVKLKGAGKNSTFIIQTDGTQPCVISSADSKGRTGFTYGSIDTASVGTGVNTVLPGCIEVEGITFANNADQDVLRLHSLRDNLFTQVRFQGSISTNQVNPPLTLNTCLRINCSNDGIISNQLNFVQCEFVNQTYAVYNRNKAFNVNFINCHFSQLYKGIVLGDGNIGGNSMPYSIKVIGSYFDGISTEAIWASGYQEGVNNIVSSCNTYADVGNKYSGFPVTNIINIGGDTAGRANKNCYSIGDTFIDRDHASAVAPVNLNGTSGFATLPNGEIMVGRQLQVGGRSVTLLDNQETAQLAGVIEISGKPTVLEYRIKRAGKERIGTMKMIGGEATITYDDDYIESDNTGVTLYPWLNQTSNVIELWYTTSSSSGMDATLLTASRTLI